MVQNSFGGQEFGKKPGAQENEQLEDIFEPESEESDRPVEVRIEVEEGEQEPAQPAEMRPAEPDKQAPLTPLDPSHSSSSNYDPDLEREGLKGEDSPSQVDLHDAAGALDLTGGTEAAVLLAATNEQSFRKNQQNP